MQTVTVTSTSATGPTGSTRPGGVETPDFVFDDDGPPPPGYIPGKRIVIVLGVVLVAVFALNLWASFHNRSEANRDEAAELLVDDPTRVRHTWTPTPDGLVEEAVSLGGGDDDVSLIRRHFGIALERRTRIGNFGTRAFRHRSLPGRDQLESLIPSMDIRSESIDGGARLTYRTDNPEAVAQLAIWGAALTRERAERG